jgi:predicted GNAT family N-acyltransferase
MSEAAGVELLVTDWATHGREITGIRHAVFVVEQCIRDEDEWDDEDGGGLHVLARLNRDAVGTGRLLVTGKIGRLAVLGAARRHGIGGLMLRCLIETARARGLEEVYLHAQVAALPFYRARGFVEEGPEFDEAGIRHQRMRLAFSSEQRADTAADRATDAAVLRR